MSGENILKISKGKDGKYRGYDTFVETEEGGKWVFEVETLKEAVKKAEEYCRDNPVEHNYTFVGI